MTWPAVEQNLKTFIDLPVGLLTALIDKCDCGNREVRVRGMWLLWGVVRVDERIILKCM